MVKESLERYAGKLYPGPSETKNFKLQNFTNHSSDESSYLSNDPIEAKILISTSLAFLAGIIQITFGICHVGYVTKYLSDSIVNGFTTGAAYHVVVSQIPTLLGIKTNEEGSTFLLTSVR